MFGDVGLDVEIDLEELDDSLCDPDYEPESDTQTDNTEDEARSQLQDAVLHPVEVNVPQAPVFGDVGPDVEIDLEELDDSLCDPDYEPESDTQTDNTEDEARSQLKDAVLHPVKVNVPQAPAAVDTTASRGRKRVRNIQLWQRNIRKRLRNSGKEYLDVNKTVKRAKLFAAYHCTCRFKCSENISQKQQENIFQSFWNLGCWEKQTGFLLACATSSEPKRRSKGAKSQKQHSHTFTLQGYRVCRRFSRRTLGITEGRLHRCLLRKRSVVPLVTDKRGRHASHRVISTEQLNDVRSHIQSFPRYRSHYTRRDSVDRTYLNPGLNLSIMYNLYIDKCKENNKTYVKKWCYAKVFNEEFNISFRKPATDTCSSCDQLQATIEHGDASARQQAEVQKQLHLRKAELARDAYKTDTSCTDEDRQCIVFDLQKTLPTPHLNTNKVYYMRQLWTYNLAIHDTTSDHAYMHMWDETQASRGSQEVASCLLHYCKTLPTTVNHITAYSDCCGGQNRNENIALTWMYIVQSEDYAIKSVDHKFFEPGHSYNVCDQDFGLIEKRKRRVDNIWIPGGWQDLVRQSSKKFSVVEMNKEEMKSLEKFRKVVTCRKKASDGNNVEWLKLRWMHFESGLPYIMSFKPTLSNDFPFRQVSFGKVGRPASLPNLGPLYTEQRALKAAKVKDLHSLLMFVPPVYHEFYNSLKAETSVHTDETEDIEDTDSEELDEELGENNETTQEAQTCRKQLKAKVLNKMENKAISSEDVKISQARTTRETRGRRAVRKPCRLTDFV